MKWEPRMLKVKERDDWSRWRTKKEKCCRSGMMRRRTRRTARLESVEAEAEVEVEVELDIWR